MADDDPVKALNARHRYWLTQFIRHNVNASTADRELLEEV